MSLDALVDEVVLEHAEPPIPLSEKTGNSNNAIVTRVLDALPDDTVDLGTYGGDHVYLDATSPVLRCAPALLATR